MGVSDSKEHYDYSNYSFLCGLSPLYVYFVFVLLLTQTGTIIPKSWGYVLAAGGYGLLTLTILASGTSLFVGDRTIVTAVFILAAVFVITAFRSPSWPIALRIVAFLPLIVINLFVIPNAVPRRVFYGVLSRTSAVFVLLGLPAIVTGSFGPVPSYWVVSPPPGFPIGLHGLTSFFSNPNVMGAFAALGTLASVWEYSNSKSRVAIILTIVNALGVYFSQGRAAALALGVGLTMLFVYHFAGRRGLRWVTVTGGVTAVIAILMAFKIIPGPEIVQTVNLNYRRTLWTAAYRAFLERPIVGWGPGEVPDAMLPYIDRPHVLGAGPHTSYIRMFALGGLVGGSAYLYLCGKCLYSRLITVEEDTTAIEYGMVILVLVLHTFSGSTIFGLQLTSTIPAIVLGYAQYAAIEDRAKTSL